MNCKIFWEPWQLPVPSPSAHDVCLNSCTLGAEMCCFCKSICLQNLMEKLFSIMWFCSITQRRTKFLLCCRSNNYCWFWQEDTVLGYENGEKSCVLGKPGIRSGFYVTHRISYVDSNWTFSTYIWLTKFRKTISIKRIRYEHSNKMCQLTSLF